MQKTNDVKNFVKYIVVNGSVTVLNFIIYFFSIEIFHVWYVAANVLAYMIAVIIAFLLNKRLVFKQQGGTAAEAAEFFVMKLAMGAASTFVLWILVHYAAMNPYISAVIVTGVFFMVSYFASKMIFVLQDKMIDWLKLLRVNHWIKNILVFLPPLCGGRFLEDVRSLECCVFIFVALCLLSSTVYVINDICDYENDRYNPRKQKTPLVSGRITKREAKNCLAAVLLLSFGFFVLLYLFVSIDIWIEIFLLAILYLAINIGYSVWKLKNVPVVESMILVVGYILRLEIGGCLTKTPISSYLLLTMCGLALYMVMEKRLAEKRLPEEFQRSCIKRYSESWLAKIMNLGLTMSMVFFSLWALERFQTAYTIFLIIGALVLYLRYSFDVDCYEEADPMTVIYKDRLLLFMGIAYFLFVAALLLYVR